jgi:hypothetical protein
LINVAARFMRNKTDDDILLHSIHT